MCLDLYVRQVMPDGNEERIALVSTQSRSENMVIPDFSSIINEWISSDSHKSLHYFFELHVDFE